MVELISTMRHKSIRQIILNTGPAPTTELYPRTMEQLIEPFPAFRLTPGRAKYMHVLTKGLNHPARTRTQK